MVADGDAYKRLIGRLLYLVMARVDISYFVQRLSQCMQKLKKSHMDSTLIIICYIKGCRGQRLLFPASNITNMIDITAFCDSDWAACPLTRRSLSDYCLKIVNVMVSWNVKKQPTFSRSLTEAEYRPIGFVVSEVI